MRKKFVSTILILVLVGTVFFVSGKILNPPAAGLTLAPASQLFFFEALTERVKTFFTFGSEAKAKRYLMLAEERLNEMRALVESKNPQSAHAGKFTQIGFRALITLSRGQKTLN